VCGAISSKCVVKDCNNYVRYEMVCPSCQKTINMAYPSGV